MRFPIPLLLIACAYSQILAPIISTRVSGAVSVSDDFNRADGGLGANWTTGVGTPYISSNQVTGLAGNNAAFWSASTFSPNQRSSATYSASPATGCHGPTARTVGSNFYRAVACGVDVYIQRVISGDGGTTLGSSHAVTLAANDVLRLEVTGTGATVTLRIYKNGVQQGGDETDTSGSRLLSGKPGFCVRDEGAYITAWAGADL